MILNLNDSKVYRCNTIFIAPFLNIKEWIFRHMIKCLQGIRGKSSVLIENVRSIVFCVLRIHRRSLLQSTLSHLGLWRCSNFTYDNTSKHQENWGFRTSPSIRYYQGGNIRAYRLGITHKHGYRMKILILI